MGFKIKEARLGKGISQDELATKASVSRTIISGLESGSITTTTTDTLIKLARALEKTVDEIFFEDTV